MKTLFALLAGTLWIIAFSGCEAVNAPPPAGAFFAARLQDCQSDTPIPARETFGPGEVPALVCVHYQGQTVTVRVYNVTSGAIAWNKTDFLPSDRSTTWWSLKVLPPGSYKAEILIGGTVRQGCFFNIARPVIKKQAT